MSRLNREIVAYVSRLAKLPLRKGEIAKFGGQLSKIFDYVDKISEMKTKSVNETSQVTGIVNKFRKDVIRKDTMLTQVEALSNAKKTHKGYFVVKAIFKE